MKDSDNHAQSAPDITAAPDSFIDKWLARWPEWAVAQVFVPPAQRRTLLAWAALQQELTDAAWGGQDARPGEAKLGWWQEELLGWSRGLRRHPLGSVLQGQIEDWQILANVLPALRDSRERPADAAEAFAQVEVVARAFAGIDAALEAELLPGLRLGEVPAGAQRADARLAMKVHRSAFTPPPKVMSAIVHVTPAAMPEGVSARTLERLTEAAFGQRRKMLRQSLKGLPGALDALAELGIEAERRAETLSVAEFVAIARLLTFAAAKPR